MRQQSYHATQASNFHCAHLIMCSRREDFLLCCWSHQALCNRVAIQLGLVLQEAMWLNHGPCPTVIYQPKQGTYPTPLACMLAEEYSSRTRAVGAEVRDGWPCFVCGCLMSCNCCSQIACTRAKLLFGTTNWLLRSRSLRSVVRACFKMSSSSISARV